MVYMHPGLIGASMGEASVRCSIVIRAYNEEKHIGRLLAGVLEQSVKDVEIILVDSGSTDATVAIASRYPVQILSIDPTEFTFGKSLNLGCAQASGEYIVISSAHVYPVYPDWLERILAPFEDEQIGLVYGKQRGDQSSKFSERQVLASWFPDDSMKHQDHPFCNNANAAIRRVLWEQHPYDEKLPALEDLEWATWAMQEGYYVSYVADAEVIHVHDETMPMIYNRYRREAMALKQIRPQEQFHLWEFVRLYLSNVLHDNSEALSENKFLREFWGIMRFRLFQLWGTYRGFLLSGSLTKELKSNFYYPRPNVSSKIEKRPISPIDYGSSTMKNEDG